MVITIEIVTLRSVSLIGDDPFFVRLIGFADGIQKCWILYYKL